jgi:cyclic-di-GMP-binding protein
VGTGPGGGRRYALRMPTFDIVSEVDMQEVRNAVDQANREAATRFDFKNTDSSIELGDNDLVLRSSTEDRLRALHQVLHEKLVKRQVSLKAFDAGKVEEAQKGTVRQHVAIRAGISTDHAKKLNKFIKDLGLKGVSSQTQGDQLRVTGKKRDDLQEVIAKCKAEDFGIPLQFTNFRD